MTMTSKPEPYNPLARVNLGRSVENALLAQPVVPLAGLEPFIGAGVYALYYSGGFSAYTPISDSACVVPIYVGKAVPPGSRRGKLGLTVNPGRALYSRLNDHEKSVAEAVNLDAADFWCRYLVVEDIWIPLGESLLIAHFKPVWNQALGGFGLHDPGSGRHGSLRSDWDELHPGRSWYSKMTSATTPEELEERVAEHFAAHPPRRPEELPAPGADDEISDEDTTSA